MSTPRRHHLVPQLHLRRFSDPDGRIVAVSRDLSKTFQSNVGNVAVEKFFYTVETENGPSTEVEELLSKIESDAEAVIRSILGGAFPPPPEAKEALASFIGLQWLRGSDQRANFEELMNQFLKFFSMNITRTQLQESSEAVAGKPASEAEIDSMLKFFADPTKYNFEQHQNESIKIMLDLAPGIANLAANRKWQLLRFPADCLLTSDSPVSLWSPPEERRGIVARGGFGMSREVRFPLDRRHALVLAWELKEGEIVRDLPIEHARVLNFWTANHGHRWIFHHPEDHPLKGMKLSSSGPRITFDGPMQRIVPEGE